jgi:hypothetical protein
MNKYSFEIKCAILVVAIGAFLFGLYWNINYTTPPKAAKIIAGLQQAEKDRARKLPIGKKEPVVMYDMRELMERTLSPEKLAEVKRIEAERNQPKVAQIVVTQ